MRIVTANVNGIRAAARKGGLDLLHATGAQVVTLQEVRAPGLQLAECLAAAGFGDSGVVYTAGDAAGRCGVAVVSSFPLLDSRTGLPGCEECGRWIEATVESPAGPLVVVSVYAPKGHVGHWRQEFKIRFLAAAERRAAELIAGDADAVITGDLNVARTEQDIKNWKDRIGKAGFLPEERAVLDRWEQVGWVDLGRNLGGPGPGPYTWWSNRGRAFDNNAGWRIDYLWATPRLAERARAAAVLRAATWDTRWSDHAPVQVDFAEVSPP